MKKTFYCLVIFASLQACANVAFSQTLTKLWETDSTFKVPESTLYYAEEKIIFVSNIDGKSNEKDLKGSISKLNTDGTVKQHDWAINLSAPKGMAISGNKLYVADLDEVVSLDVKTGEVLQRIPVKESIFLNDVTIAPNGDVFVSDSRKGNIHRIQGSTVTTFIDNKKNVNGLLYVGDALYFVAGDTLFKAKENKQMAVVTTGMDASTDGIIETKNGELVVSCWNGIIYYIKNDGSKLTLLDSRPEKINTADIGFDKENNVLYVPTFFHNKVMAYRLH